MDALERDGGTVSVLGADNQSKEFLDLKEDIGVVLDETFVPEVINAKQLGKIMAGTYQNWDQSVYDGWIRRFDLPPDKKFKDYSRPAVNGLLRDVGKLFFGTFQDAVFVQQQVLLFAQDQTALVEEGDVVADAPQWEPSAVPMP